MDLSTAGNLGRRGSCLPSADARMRQCEGEEHIGVADHVVVEEIVSAGAEVADVEGPAFERNCEAKFVLLVMFAMEWKKSLHEDRIVYRNERRSLIVAPVESAQHPAKMRNLDGGTDAGVCCI